MRIVLGVLAPDRGEVRWGGRPVDAPLRARFGYMPEERGLYPKMRVREQLVYLARLHGDAAARPGPPTGGSSSSASPSGGRPRREALARQPAARAAGRGARARPELLVLDEPFCGLDPVGVDVLASVLVDCAATGVPVVFSSHQLELVERLCDAVAIIKDGRLVAAGTVDELRAPRRDEAGGARRGRRAATTGARVPAGRARAGRERLVRCATGRRGACSTPRAAGSVTRFEPVERPTLTDLFRRRCGVRAAAVHARRPARDLTERVRERSFLIATGVDRDHRVVIVVVPERARLRDEDIAVSSPSASVVVAAAAARRGRARPRAHDPCEAGRGAGGELADGDLDAVLAGGS